MMRLVFAVAAAAFAVEASSGAKCNVCPYTPGAVCCNSTLHQVCPGGVECCDCGTDACECPAAPPSTPSPPSPPTPPPPAPTPGSKVCPYTPGSVCCNASIPGPWCPGGVECHGCGAAACECPTVPNRTIVDIAEATPDLSTLVTALKAADLVKKLAGPGHLPYTLFGPTNEAFAALPKDVLAALLKPENKAALVKVLEYHVAYGEFYSDELKNGGKVVMIDGQNVTVSVSAKSVKINNATVTKADLSGSGGVLHIIDEVLLYPGFTPPAPPTPAPAPPSPGSCNVCPFKVGAVCCNQTIGQLCPKGVKCCDCGQAACECSK